MYFFNTKSVVFLHTINEKSELKILENVTPFALAPKMGIYVGINPTKYVQDLC